LEQLPAGNFWHQRGGAGVYSPIVAERLSLNQWLENLLVGHDTSLRGSKMGLREFCDQNAFLCTFNIGMNKPQRSMSKSPSSKRVAGRQL
jgi:hypothetical protein